MKDSNVLEDISKVMHRCYQASAAGHEDLSWEELPHGTQKAIRRTAQHIMRLTIDWFEKDAEKTFK